MPDQSSLTVAPMDSASQEPEIHVIPDAYYGAALKAKIEEKKPETPEEHKKSNRGVIIGAVVLFVLLAAAGLLFVNRDILFPPPPIKAPVSQVVVKAPEPVPPPSAPTGITATSTNAQSATVQWTDTSANETGFRVERHASGETFRAVTNLPPNSSSFLDVSVRPGTVYTYRLIALNASGESPPSDEASATVPIPPPAPPEQPKLPPAGLDTDSDGITDLEEALYSTEPRNPDTDADGFLDGNEVFNLYNPNGKAPASLLDSHVVRVSEAPVGWAMSIPTAWTVAMDVTDGSQATIDTKHGEKFHVRIEPNLMKQPVLDWYLAKHPDAKPTQVLEYRSKKGYTGIIGVDLLTTYIPWGDRIFVFSYDLGEQPYINYRTTYYMMLNSLMLSGVPQTPITPNAPLPFEPSATTSGVITQPVPVIQATGTGAENLAAATSGPPIVGPPASATGTTTGTSTTP